MSRPLGIFTSGPRGQRQFRATGSGRVGRIQLHPWCRWRAAWPPLDHLRPSRARRVSPRLSLAPSPRTSPSPRRQAGPRPIILRPGCSPFPSRPLPIRARRCSRSPSSSTRYAATSRPRQQATPPRIHAYLRSPQALRLEIINHVPDGPSAVSGISVCSGWPVPLQCQARPSAVTGLHFQLSSAPMEHSSREPGPCFLPPSLPRGSNGAQAVCAGQPHTKRPPHTQRRTPSASLARPPPPGPPLRPRVGKSSVPPDTTSSPPPPLCPSASHPSPAAFCCRPCSRPAPRRPLAITLSRPACGSEAM